MQRPQFLRYPHPSFTLLADPIGTPTSSWGRMIYEDVLRERERERDGGRTESYRSYHLRYVRNMRPPSRQQAS